MPRTVVAILLLPLGLLVGCSQDDRKPMPSLTITILDAPDLYQVNQSRMGLAGLETELRRVADENRRAVTGGVRAFVYIHADAGVEYYRVQDVVTLCTNLGYSNIQTHSAGPR